MNDLVPNSRTAIVRTSDDSMCTYKSLCHNSLTQRWLWNRSLVVYRKEIHSILSISYKPHIFNKNTTLIYMQRFEYFSCQDINGLHTDRNMLRLDKRTSFNRIEFPNRVLCQLKISSISLIDLKKCATQPGVCLSWPNYIITNTGISHVISWDRSW